MMHLYSVYKYKHFGCIAVHPKCFTIMGGGAMVPNQHQCEASTWMMRRPHDNGASALRWRGESYRANQVYRDYLEGMMVRGQWWEFGQDTGVTPLLFTRSAMGFSGLTS